MHTDDARPGGFMGISRAADTIDFATARNGRKADQSCSPELTRLDAGLTSIGALPQGAGMTKVVLVNGEEFVVEGDVTDVWRRLAKEKAGDELFFSESFTRADGGRQVVIARDKVLYLESVPDDCG